jgi:hypothetical protein
LFLSDQNLAVQPFDEANLNLVGSPVETRLRVTHDAVTYALDFSSSKVGSLAIGDTELLWRDRGGKVIDPIPPIVAATARMACINAARW